MHQGVFDVREFLDVRCTLGLFSRRGGTAPVGTRGRSTAGGPGPETGHLRGAGGNGALVRAD